MNVKTRNWEVLGKISGSKKDDSNINDILEILLENRGLKEKTEKDEFLNPINPEILKLNDLGIDENSVGNAIERIKKAVDNNEEVAIYGDYDADGICATAILWEMLYGYTKKVLPHIPDRFSEGYGINPESIKNLKFKIKNLKLIITVDNGIVAYEGVNKANELGIDVIVTDHHQAGDKPVSAHSIIHSDKISGSGVAWVLAREIKNKLQLNTNFKFQMSNLELAAIGTIADQLPLIGPNRSIVKHGLVALNNTKRPGLNALLETAAAKDKSIGTYEVNFQIAPRLNAMGRLKNGIDSLRLICTKDKTKSQELAKLLNKVNIERQKIVEQVVIHSMTSANRNSEFSSIILSHESYHEGVIGLAAGKLAEKYYRPAIVISKGEAVSKASARSIFGFNIIDNIRKLEHLIIEGGGHPMAAGFSIKTDKIEEFALEFEKLAKELLTADLLSKKTRIDTELHFGNISYELINSLKQFEPIGNGNPPPVFVTNEVKVIDSRVIGSDFKHLKLSLEKDGKKFPAIGFNMATDYHNLKPNDTIDVVYSVEENVWNGNSSIQLKVKDINLSD